MKKIDDIKKAETLSEAIGNAIDETDPSVEVCKAIEKHIKHFLAQHFTVAMNDTLPKETCLKALYERVTRILVLGILIPGTLFAADCRKLERAEHKAYNAWKICSAELVVILQTNDPAFAEKGLKCERLSVAHSEKQDALNECLEAENK